MIWEFEKTKEPVVYKLLAATVTPRPIAWVLTRNEDGSNNAAPFSFFNVMGSDPPILALGIQSDSHRGGAPKDTLRNILNRREFTVNLVPETLAEQMNITAINAPQGVDELALAGLTTEPGHLLATPRIAGCPVSFECRLHSSVVTGVTQNLVIGQVVSAYVADEYIMDRDRAYLDTAAMNLIGRGFGSDYIRTGDRFKMQRPEWGNIGGKTGS